MSERSSGEKEQAMAHKLATLAEAGVLKIKQWEKARPGKKADEKWDVKDRAAIAPVFMQELAGSTTVYAVYKESPTVANPAEEGGRLTVDSYDLMNDEIPMHGGASELVAVYATKEQADKDADGNK